MGLIKANDAAALSKDIRGIVVSVEVGTFELLPLGTGTGTGTGTVVTLFVVVAVTKGFVLDTTTLDGEVFGREEEQVVVFVCRPR